LREYNSPFCDIIVERGKTQYNTLRIGEAVDAMKKAAVANGGRADINPVQDLGFMYNRSPIAV
jgi:hypothetical protein